LVKFELTAVAKRLEQALSTSLKRRGLHLPLTVSWKQSSSPVVRRASSWRTFASRTREHEYQCVEFVVVVASWDPAFSETTGGISGLLLPLLRY
jgi:hypothetical protein